MMMKEQKERGGMAVMPNKGLIDQLINCALTCEKCLSRCLSERDVSMIVRCIELNRECAEICFHTARLLVRESEISDRWVATCAEVCRLCAQECRKHEIDHCQQCADECEACADACHEYRVGTQVA
jgi:hypothetical protein